MAELENNGFSELKIIAEKSFNENEIKLIKQAYDVANNAHADQLRQSGQPYIIHPIAVANILLELGMDAQSVAAALLHDTVEDTEITQEQIKKQFGEDIATLVGGVTKLGKVSIKTKEEQQAENIRRMLLAMSQDIRVIIIKLADRLHNMRTLKFMPPQKRRDIALETLEIYAPIAHRLGIRTVKEELEDLAIKFLDPVAYDEIENSLEEQRKSRKEFLDEIKENITQRIQEAVPNANISGRIKSVHGIYRKMYMQNKNFDEIYDVYAVRIIVDSLIDCYNCLGIIHDMFHPIPGRFKDYISTPKPNMYQSLHTTVLGKEGIPFEVQIRTWEMHRTAEYGIAAHWKYKLGIKGKDKIEERLAWISQLLEAQKDVEGIDIVSTIKSDLVPEEVFVFTPKGDVINLPMGATVIDFAYAIHSAVGNKMIGAKVDGRIVPIDYQVKTGEIVEVLTSSQQGKGPSRDWLKIVKTSEAKSKIRTWFKKEKRDENIVEGKAELEREFRRNNIRLYDDELQAFLKKLSERHKCNSVDDFFAAIGYGAISINKMMPFVRDEYTKIVKSSEPKEVFVIAEKKTKGTDGVIVKGIENCLIKFSRCCNPLPGDEIIGFITRGHGVSIHKRDCTNVPKVIEFAQEPDRWIEAKWDKQKENDEFKSTLQITCLHRAGLIADLSSVLTNMHVFILSINSREGKSGRITITITISVKGVDHLMSVISRLNKVDGVLGIERSGM